MQKPGRNRKQGGGNRRRKVAEEKYREDRRQMGKTILLVSREEMLHQAHNILQEKKYTIHGMRVISTENAVMEARKAIADSTGNGSFGDESQTDCGEITSGYCCSGIPEYVL